MPRENDNADNEGLREQAGDFVDDDAGFVELDVVAGLVGRHQVGSS
jgi:hypothetical protein